MSSIQACALPQQALLAKYAQGGNYTDCYAAEVARPVSHEEYVETFYTTALFKLERLLLAWFASKPFYRYAGKGARLWGTRSVRCLASGGAECEPAAHVRSPGIAPGDHGHSCRQCGINRHTPVLRLCRGCSRRQAIWTSNARLHIQGAFGLSSALFAGAPVRGMFTPFNVRFGPIADIRSPVCGSLMLA